eukprot:jgi/Tetstr1/439080/TSEL_027570.t1
MSDVRSNGTDEGRETRSAEEREEYGVHNSTEAEDEVGGRHCEEVNRDGREDDELDGDANKVTVRKEGETGKESAAAGPEPMWHYVENGQKTGPVPESVLRQMVWDGRVGNTLVWTPGQEEWRQLSEYPQLLPTRAGGAAKRKREPNHAISPHLRTWLAKLSEEVLSKLWILALGVEELVEGCERARDKLLLMYITRDPELEGDPEDFVLSDEFFWDVIEVQGPEQAWRMMYPGCEDACLSLLAHAAECDEQIYRQIVKMHRFTEIDEVISSGNQAQLEAILERDPAIVGLTGPHGKTPLFLAVEQSKIALVQVMIDANVQRRDRGEKEHLDLDDMDMKGNTLLHVAAEQGLTEMAALLLDHGANPNIRNESGEYGDGNWSVKSRESRILEPVAQSDKTPLHIACESEDTEMAELLLSRGADPDLEDRASMTALHYAVEEGSEELLAMLLEAGANPTLGNNSIGLDNTPFHHAISRGRYGMAKMLLDTGKFDVNQPGAGWLPLHLAARRGSLKTVQLLLDAGADPKAVDGAGRSARSLAEVNKRTDCLELLSKFEEGDS